MQPRDLYKQYCECTFDKNGVLKTYNSVIPSDFNFAYDIVDKIAEMEPQKQALVWCNDNNEEKFFTFEDIMRYSNMAANFFKAQGVKKGDRVMLVLKRHYQFWFAIIALHKLGAVGVPGTNLLTVKDFDYRFKAAGISHIVCTAEDEVPARVDEALKNYDAMKSKSIARGKREGWACFDEEIENCSDKLERVHTTIDDVMLMYFTSGTTGYPKMVQHAHDYPIAHIITAKFWHNVDPDGLHLTVSDTGWMKSMWGKLYGQWICGAAVFVYDMDKFIAPLLMEKIAKYKVTTFCAPPTMYRMFIKDWSGGADFSSVKYATTAGEALNPEVYNRFYEYTGIKLMEAFGQSETTVLTLNLIGTTPKVGSMGKASPLYDVDLVDENGNSVPPGEVGEVVVRIPQKGRQNGLFLNYFNDEKTTAEACRNGIYYTGDTAWRDEDNFFWYVGRNDDIIKSSGYRIGPFEIESVLMEHPSVMECAVTGAPDPVRGTVVKATIVLTKKYSPSDELAKELQEYVKKQTAPYKYPRIVEFVTELPKTISGKIKRYEIRNK